ncbi:hypothetical protein Pyn_21717 [Prunus yedoensis var. nudiflora]|uniref:Uncharacterized protein n=1 Tax=Prunus yedoensis var. nudiflora TaxID=2094558 RepID=A0A314XV48_PRUYE|nr:hypothetical protein Pyn_21717 [Prunus yedoensis var. nudiflora]
MGGSKGSNNNSNSQVENGNQNAGGGGKSSNVGETSGGGHPKHLEENMQSPRRALRATQLPISRICAIR